MKAAILGVVIGILTTFLLVPILFVMFKWIALCGEWILGL